MATTAQTIRRTRGCSYRELQLRVQRAHDSNLASLREAGLSGEPLAASLERNDNQQTMYHIADCSMDAMLEVRKRLDAYSSCLEVANG